VRRDRSRDSGRREKRRTSPYRDARESSLTKISDPRRALRRNQSPPPKGRSQSAKKYPSRAPGPNYRRQSRSRSPRRTPPPKHHTHTRRENLPRSRSSQNQRMSSLRSRAYHNGEKINPRDRAYDFRESTPYPHPQDRQDQHHTHNPSKRRKTDSHTTETLHNRVQTPHPPSRNSDFPTKGPSNPAKRTYTRSITPDSLRSSISVKRGGLKSRPIGHIKKKME
jgi:hypothetical protein